MSELSFTIEVFEGPLDLLLHLVQKNKVSIYDIPIAKITDQYFEYIAQMEKLDMELSGDFLVMAAQLLLIKSKMLLPVHDEEEEDPRRELAATLEEYLRYKSAAENLDSLWHEMDEVVFKSAEALDLPPLPPEPINMASDALIRAFAEVLFRSEGRAPLTASNFSGILGRKRVSVRTKRRYVMRLFDTREKVLFQDVFEGMDDRGEIVATFLAVLNLIAEKKIRAVGSGKRIYCVKSGEDDGEDNTELD